MASLDFRRAWNDAAEHQGLFMRAIMRGIANHPEALSHVEEEMQSQAEAKGLGALPWADIIAALMPLLLQLLQNIIAKK